MASISSLWIKEELVTQPGVVVSDIMGTGVQLERGAQLEPLEEAQEG